MEKVFVIIYRRLSVLATPIVMSNFLNYVHVIVITNYVFVKISGYKS